MGAITSVGGVPRTHEDMFDRARAGVGKGGSDIKINVNKI